MNEQKDLCVVVPVYKSEESLEELVQRISAAAQTLDLKYEIILVEDCGPDRSWDKIVQLSQNPQNHITGVKLSRNFGQHYAISAGIGLVQSQWTVVMDCDLQDQPEEIAKLYKKATEGFDVVLARRHDRQDSRLKRFGSFFFYKFLQLLTSTEYDATVANFGIYSHKVTDVIKSMPEQIRYFPVMVKWLGFKTTHVDVNHAPRKHGESAYGFRKHLKLATDIILAYSDKPLRMVIGMGLLISVTSLGAAAYYLWKGLFHHFTVPGWLSVVVSIWFLSGVTILVLGMVGLYLGKVFEQVKGRPLYIISERCGGK